MKAFLGWEESAPFQRYRERFPAPSHQLLYTQVRRGIAGLNPPTAVRMLLLYWTVADAVADRQDAQSVAAHRCRE
jgi:hypothetical protein